MGGEKLLEQQKDVLPKVEYLDSGKFVDLLLSRMRLERDELNPETALVDKDRRIRFVTRDKPRPR